VPKAPFPPRCRWSKEFGYLNIQDPETGEWLSIHKDDAPTGYRQHAMQEKFDYWARIGDPRGAQSAYRSAWSEQVKLERAAAEAAPAQEED
jgi:hypothetical protein